MSEKKENTPIAWMTASTEFLLGVLELPPCAEILGVRFRNNYGHTTVDFLVKDEGIPQGALQVEVHYSHKSKFDRFQQTDPVPVPTKGEEVEKMVLKAGQKTKRQCRCPCTCGHSHDPKKLGTCVWCMRSQNVLDNVKAKPDGSTH